MISYQPSSSQNVGPWDAEQLHYLSATLLNCLATTATGCTARSWTRICGCLYNKLRGLGTFEWHGDNADGLSVLCHAHNCCLALCGTEAPGQESRAFTSLTAPSWALISDGLMLSGSQTVQWGVQREETEASQRETNTHCHSPVSAEMSCMTKAMKFPIFARTSSITELWCWQTGKSPNVCGAERLWKPAVWSRL